MKHVLAVIILYLFINNPFLSIFNGYSSLYVLLPLLLLLGTKTTQSFFKIHKLLVFSYSAILLFSIIRTFMGGEVYYLERIVIQYISSLLMSAVIISWFYKYDIPYFKITIWMILLAVSLSILCYTIPSFNQYIKYDFLVVRNEVVASKFYRGFGVSDALTSAYGYVLATFFAYGLYKGYGSHKWFWFLSPFIAFSILINARTAILPMIASILLYFIINHKNTKFSYYIYLFVGLVLLFNLINRSETTSGWINEFYLQMKDIITGSEEAEFDTYGTLVNSIILPETPQQWLYGRGRSFFFHDTIVRSDVGFVNQLCYGGIIYIILILITFLCLIIKVKNFYFFTFCIIVMLVGNIKGNYLETSDGYRFLTFLIMAEYYYKRMNNLYKK